jgi:hypothetical protein
LFKLQFNEPQNFAAYRQVELDTARISAFTQLEGFAYFSKRYLMKRYLGMEEQDMVENEEMWTEEQGETKGEAGAETDVGLRSVGITPGGIGGDLDAAAAMETPPEEGGAIGGVGAPEGGVVPAGTVPAGVPAGPTGI